MNVAYSGRRDLNDEGIHSSEEEAYRKCDRYLLATMLHTPHCLVPYACFVTIPAEQRICHSKTMKEYGMWDASQEQVLGQVEFAAIDRLYETLTQVITPDATGRLPTAIRYYQQAFRTDIDGSLCFLGMMMGMEALFGQGATEISHKVSERAAFFLRRDAAGREALYDKMHKAYNFRSRIAHGGAVKKSPQDLHGFLLFTLRESLVKVLADPKLLALFHSAKDKDFARAMKRACIPRYGRIGGVGTMKVLSIPRIPQVTPDHKHRRTAVWRALRGHRKPAE